MKTKIAKTVYHSLLIEARELQGLFDFMAARYPTIQIMGFCVDGSRLVSENVTDILAFENLNFRRIRALHLDAREGADETCSVQLSAGAFNSAEVEVSSARDETAVYVTRELLQRLSDMKPDYDLLTRVSPSLVIGVLGTFPLLVIGFLQAIGVSRLSAPFPFMALVPIMFFSLVLGLAISFPLDYGWRFLFPRLFFCIGKQQRRLDQIRQWRSLVFVSILLAIVVGIVTNAISRYF